MWDRSAIEPRITPIFILKYAVTENWIILILIVRFIYIPII